MTNKTLKQVKLAPKMQNNLLGLLNCQNNIAIELILSACLLNKYIMTLAYKYANNFIIIYINYFKQMEMSSEERKTV